MEILALKDLLGLLDWLAKLEILDCLEIRENPDCQDQGVLMGKMGPLEKKEYRVLLGQVDLMVNPDLLDHQVQ